MKQKSLMIKLFDLTEENHHPYGNTMGRKVFRKLWDFVDSHPTQQVFEVSLEGITATDASFPRESVISLAKQLRGEKWFFITHFNSNKDQVDNDLVANWDYAAIAKGQPIVTWNEGKASVIGPKPKSAAQELLNYLFDRGSATTANVAKDLDMTVQNASTKLKKLVVEGLIYRTEETATSGGIEFTYNSIK